MQGKAGQLAALDQVVANAPAAILPAVTVIRDAFKGMPATLSAGITNFKMTNAAPKEDHEMGFVPLNEAGKAIDPVKLFAMSDKKAAKYADFSKANGMFAPAGESGYTVATLEPGTYVYGCFIPLGGKKKGAPHFTEGMYGTFTVS